MKPLIISALLCLVGGCTTSIRPSSGIADPINVDDVDLGDGVDRREAERIALKYFDEFHGSCGGLELSKETAKAWFFRAMVGFAAMPMPDIVVLKDGSTVSQRGTPTARYSDGVWRYKGRNFFNFESKG